MFLVTVLAGAILLPEPVRAARHRPHAEPRAGWLTLPKRRDVARIVWSVRDMLVFNVVVFTGIGLLMPVFKLYAYERYHFSETLIGAMVAPGAAALGAVAVPLGRLSDRWGVLRSVRYGMALCAVGMWLIALSPSLMAAMVGTVMLGAGFMAAYPAWMAVASGAGPPGQRGRIVGTVGMAEGLGAVIGVPIGPVIYASRWSPFPRLGVTHITLPFYFSALLLTLAMVLAFTWVRVRRRRAAQAAREARPE